VLFGLGWSSAVERRKAGKKEVKSEIFEIQKNSENKIFYFIFYFNHIILIVYFIIIKYVIINKKLTT